MPASLLAPVRTLPPPPPYVHSGLAFDYQLVNVDDYQGAGESSPSPHFYQNLGEAEFVVS